MRKLMWLSIGFGAACAVCSYLLSGNWLYGTAGVLMVLTGVVWFALRKCSFGKLVGAVCLGFLLGQLWYCLYDGFYLRTARSMDGVTVDIIVTATDYGYTTDYGVTADGTVLLDGKPYQVRMYLDGETLPNPGDTVHGSFRLRYTGAGGRKPSYHGGSGIFLLAYSQENSEISRMDGKNIRYLPAYLRQQVLSSIDQVFPADAAPFAKALLMGDTSDFDYETSTNLTLSGIRHVVAVSGLHVSILFSLVYLITGKRRISTALAGLPCLLLFAAMAGFTPSITRACVMQALMILALVCRQEYDPPTALGFAALVILIGNPVAITSAGFQLSVGSVAGIFLFSGRLRNWLSDRLLRRSMKKGGWVRKTVNQLIASVSVSLSATVLTVPLVAGYFGAVSLVSVITNLLCLWVISFLFCGIIAACVMSMLWLPAAKAVGWFLSWIVRYVLGVSRFLGGLPGAVVYTKSVYIVIWLVLCYVLLAVYLLSGKQRPGTLAVCAAVSLCVALVLSWAEPLLDTYRVTVLDVGQGQCILLQSGGRTYMVDCGGDYEADVADDATALLHSQGIYRLDGLILTHYDRDHVGAAEHLLTRLSADVLILPEGEDADGFLSAIAGEHGGRSILAEEDVEITWGDAKITVFSSQNDQNSNESSLCVLFHTEKCDILITGDRSAVGELQLLQHAALPQLDGLIVGHHGADDSTSPILLETLKPQVAIISVGADNRFGHPADKVLQRLAAFGCRIYRTDLQGTIILRG